MSAAVLQSKGATSNTPDQTTPAATFDNAVVNRSTLIAFVQIYEAVTTVGSLADSQGNTWTLVGNKERSSSDTAWELSVWAAVNVIGGSSFQVTATLSGGNADYTSIAIIEVSGGGSIAGQNNTEMNPPVGGVVSGAAVTPTAKGLHLAAMSYNETSKTISPSAGWTEVIEVDEANASGGPVIVERRVAVSGASQTASWATNMTPTTSQALIQHVVVADPIKTVNGTAIVSVKTINGRPVAEVKTLNGTLY